MKIQTLITTFCISSFCFHAQQTAEPIRTFSLRSDPIFTSHNRAFVTTSDLTNQALIINPSTQTKFYMNNNTMLLQNNLDTRNHRAIYSSLWAFASLNYLYCDLVGFMDKDVHAQYQTGVVNGLAITPEFLTMAAAFMQIPLANVALPHLIKNDKILQWVQIGSGAIMSVVQAATLFAGKPSSYYILFSAIEIGTTAYITFDALRWKRQSKKLAMQISQP